MAFGYCPNCGDGSEKPWGRGEIMLSCENDKCRVLFFYIEEYHEEEKKWEDGIKE